MSKVKSTTKRNTGLFDGDFKQNNKASKPLLILNKCLEVWQK